MTKEQIINYLKIQLKECEEYRDSENKRGIYYKPYDIGYMDAEIDLLKSLIGEFDNES